MAMRNELVLARIARNMELSGVRSARETSSIWNHGLMPALRDKQQVIELTCQPQPQPLGPWDPWTWTPRTINEYNQLVANSVELPHSKFLLMNVSTRTPELTDFLRPTFCGPVITRLDLQFRVGDSGNIAAADIDCLRWIIFEQTPNLKDLRLHGLPAVNVQPLFSPWWQWQFSLRPSVAPAPAHSGPAPVPCLAIAASDLPNLRRLTFCVPVTRGWSEKPIDADGDGDENAMVVRMGEVVELHPQYTTLLADLLRHAINLEELELDKQDRTRNFEAVAGLRDHMHEAVLAKLKTLKIYMLGAPELQILLDLAGRGPNAGHGRKNLLRLRTLFTSIVYANENFEKILQPLWKSFLESQSECLRHLSLQTVGCPSRDVFTIRIPNLAVLRTFSLTCTGSGARGPLAQPLQTSFPRLARFEYIIGVHGHIAADDDLWCRHDGVTDLNLSLAMASTSNHTQQTGRVFLETYGARFRFEILTRLELKLCAQKIAEGLPYIYEIMSALEVLQLNCEDDERSGALQEPLNLDYLLTGIERSHHGELLRLLALQSHDHPLTVAEIRSFLVGTFFKTGLAIEELRALKKFVLLINGSGRVRPGSAYELTDVGGYFGFFFLTPEIQHIEIGVQGHGGQENLGNAAGNSFSEMCKELIKSIMSPYPILCFY